MAFIQISGILSLVSTTRSSNCASDVFVEFIYRYVVILFLMYFKWILILHCTLSVRDFLVYALLCVNLVLHNYLNVITFAFLFNMWILLNLCVWSENLYSWL